MKKEHPFGCSFFALFYVRIQQLFADRIHLRLTQCAGQCAAAYAHDTLTLYGVGEADVRRLGLPYAPAEQGWRVTVPDPAAAAELIRREPALFRDFELTKGRMDDVFLAVTGKKLAGGAEK